MTDTRPTPISRHAVTFIFITVLLDMVGFGIIIPVLPKLIGDVADVSLAEAAKIGGWMAAAYAIAQFAFGPLMGNLSDRFGRRPLLLLAILGLGLDFLAQAWAPTTGWLFAGRILAGLCGASWVIANAYIADVTAPEDRGKAFGMMGAAFGLGFIIGPVIGGLLGEFGARVPFYVAAVVSGVNLMARSNPFGAFKIFAQYKGVLPLCLVLALFFFFSSVYPAIWAFWGKVRFGWSEAMIGLTLAVFGVVIAAFQGGLTGRFVKIFGDQGTVILGFISAIIAGLGYGVTGSLVVIFGLMVVHGPEGFINPLLTARMSKRVPENAQGELQGGISAITNIAMLAGTVFYAQVFGYFMSPAAPFQSPNVAYYVTGAGMALTFGLFLWVSARDREGTGAP